MDTAVETRRGIWITVLRNHLLSAVFCFLLVIFAFKWLYASSVGIVILFAATTAFYLSGIYSYTYDQPKLDMILKGRYDYLMPLKMGGASGALIFSVAGVHMLLSLINPVAANQIAPFCRFWNYPFFYFFYGADGWYFNFPAVFFLSALPVLAAYVSYSLGVRRFSFVEKLNRIIYKKNK